MKQNPYSYNKALWYTDKIQELREGGNPSPPHVQLILSDLCNQDCHFCAYRMSAGFSSKNFGEMTPNGLNMNPNRKIPTEKAMEIVEDCAELGVKGIQFTGGGEPTVHKDHLKIMGYAQELGMKTALVTNAVLLKHDPIIANMSWVRVSVDAGNSEDYNRIRKSDMWERAWTNINWLGSLDTDIIVGLGFVITKENYNGIEDFAELAAASGVNNIRFSAMFSEEGASHYEDVHDEILEKLERAKQFERDDFSVNDLYRYRIDDLEQGKPDYDLCGYQYFNCYIGGDMKVYRCCTTAYTNIGEVGNLNGQRFKNWYHSDAKKQAYSNFNAKTCHTCQFNNQNKAINFVVNTPIHVEFV